MPETINVTRAYPLARRLPMLLRVIQFAATYLIVHLQRHEYGTFFVWVIATLVIILIWAVPALIKRWRLRRAERRVFGS